MTSTEVTGIVLALGAGIGGILTAIAALINSLSNSRTSKHEQDETRAQISELKSQRAKDRGDIILIGESLAQCRADNAIIAEAFNEIWNEFTQVTGHKPAANLDALRRLQTIKYITGRLTPFSS